MTVYMDLKDLARKAVEEADKMGRNQEVDVNADSTTRERALLHPT